MRFLVLFCALLAWSAKADAVVYDDNFQLSEVTDVRVLLQDAAEGGCWTNLKEVREYAEEKLRMKGTKVTYQRDRAAFDIQNEYDLFITVNSKRYYKDGSGNCIGKIRLELVTHGKLNGLFHVSTIAATDGITSLPKLNR